MESKQFMLLVAGMLLATYVSRMLPAALVGKLRLSPRAEKFLNLIPYTAMTALIFPGVLTVDTERPEIGIVGGLAAALLAWRKCPPIACVLAAVAVDLLLYLL